MTLETSKADIPDRLNSDHLQRLPVAVVVSDPSLEGHPIIYVNDAYEAITGYDAAEVVGRGYDILYGQDTDPAEAERFSAALDGGRELSIDLLNYRKDGAAFWNRLLITPVEAARVDGHYYLAIMSALPAQPEASARAAELDERLRELQHRVKNHMALIVAMIRGQADRLQPKEAALLLAKRVETISLLYTQVGVDAEARDTIALADYAMQVAGAMQALSDSVAVKLNIETEDIVMGLEDAARIGLILSEVLTNALRHAFGDSTGRTPEVSVTLTRKDARLMLQIDDNGGGLKGRRWPDSDSHGGQIVLDLVKRLKGALEVGSSGEGVRVTLTLPDPAHGPLGGRAAAR
ncbi:MAG: PAS domain-containing protein [Oceanicaulis sp.]